MFIESLLTAARLLLFVIFGAAALSKLLGLGRFRSTLTDFGLPAATTPFLAPAIIAAEALSAFGLIFSKTAWPASLACVALLLIFTSLLALTLLKGQHPSCSCFGQISTEPIGWKNVLRNILILAPAVLIAAAGRYNAGWSALEILPQNVHIEFIGLGLVSVFSVIIASAALWLGFQLMAQNGRLLARLEAIEANGVLAPIPPSMRSQPFVGLPIGSVAPNFSLPGLYGEVLTLETIRAGGKPVLLAFTDPGCGSCNALLPDLAKWQSELNDSVSLVIITRGNAAENLTKSKQHGSMSVLLEKEREVSGTYLATSTPSAVLVNVDGTIASALAIGSDEIRSLVARSMGGSGFLAGLGEHPSGFKHSKLEAAPFAPQLFPAPAISRVGEPAPNVKLPNLHGELVELQNFKGQNTLILFWNTNCHFCQNMLPELQAWEATSPNNPSRVLIISAGTKQANEAQGLSSTIVIDPNFSAGASFGVNGTPSAVLVDSEGKIASDVAVGKNAVLALSSRLLQEHF